MAYRDYAVSPLSGHLDLAPGFPRDLFGVSAVIIVCWNPETLQDFPLCREPQTGQILSR